MVETGPSVKAAGPFGLAEFDAAMVALGPFEAAPHLAVAVSGGADSMALCLLADAWARVGDGRITALTVDHRLRSGSSAEADQVGLWLQARGIRHRVLPWTGKKPQNGVQEAARRARYALLSEYCRDNGILHLLVGHHLEDQAETMLMRLAHGSGLMGLAAMAPVTERPEVRVLRPLLNVAPRRLRDWLDDRHQSWLADPSNDDPAYERTKVRAILPRLAGNGWPADRIAQLCQRVGQARAALTDAMATLIAQSGRLYPAGYAVIDRAALTSAPPKIAASALAYLLAGIGGREYAPSRDRLERLVDAIGASTSWRGGTLAGCRLCPGGSSLLICRELRGLPAPEPVGAETEVVWDGRFRIGVRQAAIGAGAEARVGALGGDGWRQIVGARPELRRHPLPGPARRSLPALIDHEGVFAVPHLGYHRPGPNAPGIDFASVQFRPKKVVGGAGSFLA